MKRSIRTIGARPGSAALVLAPLLVAAHLLGSRVDADPGGTLDLNPFYSCGLSSLFIVAKWHGLAASLAAIEADLRPNRAGETSIAALERTSRHLGLDPVAARVGMEQLGAIPLPAIVHLKSRAHQSQTSHYVVLAGLDPRGVILVDAPEIPTLHPYGEFAVDWTGVVIAFPEDRARRDSFLALLAHQRSWAMWAVGLIAVTFLGGLAWASSRGWKSSWLSPRRKDTEGGTHR